MTYEISMTPQTKNDLRDIPKRFRVYDKEPWRSRNLRIMPADNYLVDIKKDLETVKSQSPIITQS